jgi:elongation factor 4
MNKIDLPHARPEVVADQLVSVLDMKRDDIIRISAKMGIGIKEVLDSIVERIPPPDGKLDQPLRALIFDSWFRMHRGAIALVTVVDGVVKMGDKIQCFHTGKEHLVQEVGVFRPEEDIVDQLHAGQVGFIMAMKEATDAMIGDTVSPAGQEVEAFDGFQRMKPVVFAGFFPVDQSNSAGFEKCMKALTLNDPSVEVVRDNSPLGQGYRLGFLGFLHLDVFRQRLIQEYDANAVITAPSVIYKIKRKGSSVEEEMHQPQAIPSYFDCDSQMEPMVMATILSPNEYEPAIRALCQERRGEEKEKAQVDDLRTMFKYRIPLNEIIIDFHEQLKVNPTIRQTMNSR